MWRTQLRLSSIPVQSLVVAALGGVVTGQPGRHGQQLPDGDPAQPRIGVGGQMGGQQLADGLVQALQVAAPRAMPTSAEVRLLVTEKVLWPSLASTPCQ